MLKADPIPVETPTRKSQAGNKNHCKLLIVDNEQPIRQLIRSLVPDELDIVVVGEASDGVQALELCRKHQPQIVITDIRMPEMNGLELAEALRRLVPACKVIVVSGFDDFAYAQQAIEQGVVGYLLKPIDEIGLFRALLKARQAIHQQHDSHARMLMLKRELNKLQSSGTSATVHGSNGYSDNPIVNRMFMVMHENYNRDLSLDEVARQMFMSTAYLSRLFKEKTGRGFIEVLVEIRVDHAKTLLLKPELRIREIADMVGYTDCSHFIKTFRKFTGTTPSAYRRHLEVVETPL